MKVMHPKDSRLRSYTPVPKDQICEYGGYTGSFPNLLLLVLVCSILMVELVCQEYWVML